MKVLLIDNYDSFTYNIVALLQQLEIENITIKKNNEISVAEANEYDKIIISPGPATPAEAGNILEIIKLLAPTKSILGICLGHQAIAQAFGATLSNVSHPYHGFQTEISILKEHKLFSNLPKNKKIYVGLYHSWIVNNIHFPACLQITSLSKEDIIMSVKHVQYDVHGIQFHPESYMTSYGKEMLKAFLI